MAWSDARAKVRDLLSVVAITEPVTETVRTVHEFSPAAIEPGDLPCFVIMPPHRTGERYSGTLRRIYTSRVQFFCRDEDVKDAVNIADAYSEATLTAFENALKGDGVDASLQLIGFPSIDPVSGMTYADASFIGFEFTITLQFVQSHSPTA